MTTSRKQVCLALSVSAALHLLILLIPPGRGDVPKGMRFRLSPVPSASWIEILRASRPELTVDGMERLPGPGFVLPQLTLTDLPFDDLPQPAAPELTKTDSLWLAARTEKGLWLPPEEVPVDLNELALAAEARKAEEVEGLDEYARHFAGDSDTTDQASKSHRRARQVVMRAIDAMGGWQALAALTELHAGVWLASTTHRVGRIETRVPLYYYPTARWHFSAAEGFSSESVPVELSLDPDHPNEPYQRYSPGSELSAYRSLFSNLWRYGPPLPNEGTPKRLKGHLTRWHFLERFLGHAVVLSYIGKERYGRAHTDVEAIRVNDHKYGQYFEAFFSRETGVLVAVIEGFTEYERRWAKKRGGRLPDDWTTEYADYRPVNGVLLPHHIRRRQGSAFVSIHLQLAHDAGSLSSSPPAEPEQ